MNASNEGHKAIVELLLEAGAEKELQRNVRCSEAHTFKDSSRQKPSFTSSIQF